MVKYDTFIFKHKIIKIILYLLARLQALFPFVFELCYLLRALLYSVTWWDHTCTPFPPHGGITPAHHFRHMVGSHLHTISVTWWDHTCTPFPSHGGITLAHHFRHLVGSHLHTISVTWWDHTCTPFPSPGGNTLAHHFSSYPPCHVRIVDCAHAAHASHAAHAARASHTALRN